MKDIAKKTIAFTTSAIMFAGAIAPQALAQGTEIIGNGSFSVNSATSTNNESETVVQNNEATFTNSINVSSNTGGNVSDFNTGGNVGIATGASLVGVEITNAANLNQAALENSQGTYGTGPVSIALNGAASVNNVDQTTNHEKAVFQDNEANFSNAVTTNSNTGNNSASFGTNGDSTILTGQSTTLVAIENWANANVVQNTPSLGLSSASSGLNNIFGNGALSQNSIGSSNNESVLVTQNNSASIANAVTAESSTGNNDVSYGTGGDQLISTGPTTFHADIHNAANFNQVSLPNGSWLNQNVTDLDSNGAYSQNFASRSNNKNTSLFQDNGGENGNGFVASNSLLFTPSSGDNASTYNTQPGNGISHVLTGPTVASVTVDNSGNANIAGSSWGSFHLPNGTRLSLGFNLHSVLNQLF